MRGRPGPSGCWIPCPPTPAAQVHLFLCPPRPGPPPPGCQAVDCILGVGGVGGVGLSTT